MIKTHTLIITAALLVLATSLASMPSSHAQTPDFNITATPREICINPGEAASYVITISSTDGFEGNVELADTIDPNATDGPTLSPIPSDVGLTRGQAVTFNLTASTVQATPAGVYTITIIGATNATLHSATVYLTVQSACGAVGGKIVPMNRLGLLAPYSSIAFTVVGLAVGATLFYARRSRVR